MILAEERSVAIGKLFRSTLDKMELRELVAWGGTSISECRVPPPYLSPLYQSTSSALPGSHQQKIFISEVAKHWCSAARYTYAPYPYLGHIFTRNRAQLTVVRVRAQSQPVVALAPCASSATDKRGQTNIESHTFSQRN